MTTLGHLFSFTFLPIFQSHHMHNPEIQSTLSFYVCCSFSFVFFVCEIGECVNRKFNEINNLFNQLKWYLIPMKEQSMLPIIMKNLQNPVVLGCFGSVLCLRITFKTVGINQTIFLHIMSNYQHNDHLNSPLR